MSALELDITAGDIDLGEPDDGYFCPLAHAFRRAAAAHGLELAHPGVFVAGDAIWYEGRDTSGEIVDREVGPAARGADVRIALRLRRRGLRR